MVAIQQHKKKHIYHCLNAIYACFDDKKFDHISYSRTLTELGKLLKGVNFVNRKRWLEQYWAHNPRFLNAWYAKSKALFSSFNAQAFSNSIYALGQLGLEPSTDWLVAWYSASKSKLDTFKPQELSCVRAIGFETIYGLAGKLV